MDLRRRWMIILVLTTVLAVSMACSGRQQGGDEPVVPTEPATATLTVEPTAEPTATATVEPVQPEVSVDLGEIQRNDEGGFSFRPVPGYSVTSLGGMTTMVAQGVDPAAAPLIMIVGDETDGATLEELYERLQSGTPMTVGEPEPLTVQGMSGLVADLSGDYNGMDMQGRVAVVKVTPTQQFMLLVGAPADSWDAVAPYFDALLASIEFFEPVTQ